MIHLLLVISSWKTEYKGNSALLFRKRVENANRQLYNQAKRTEFKDSTISNFIPILQSSGMGKSRLVDEVGKKVLTISICLKKGDDGSKYGFRRIIRAYQRVPN